MNAKRLLLAGITSGIASPLLFGVVADPVFSPSAGGSDTTVTLAISSPTPGAVIHYTLNGAEPTLYDPVYSTTLTINRTWTVKAKAWSGVEASNTTSAGFLITGAVAAGSLHSVALKSTGPVLAWGQQQYGRLGNNLTAIASVATPASSRYTAAVVIGDATAIAGGADQTVILKSGGTVWAYGRNNLGQLGISTATVQSGLAKQVTTNSGGTTFLSGCVSVAAGNGFGAALVSNGQVYTWGEQLNGRLGNGSLPTVSTPRAYAGKVYTVGTTALTGINRIAASNLNGMAKEASAKETGSPSSNGYVWVWGANPKGQLAQNSFITGTGGLKFATKMLKSAGVPLKDAWDISCGELHTAVVCWKDSDPNLQGRVYCCGERLYGRLGHQGPATTQATLNTAANVTLPVEVIKADGSPLDGIQEVAAGSAHTLALDANGNVWAWGYNGNGALGDGGNPTRGYAAKVRNPTNSGDLGNIVRIAAGGTGTGGFSLAVAADGTVYAWGYNSSGQLGRGGTNVTNSNLPVAVTGSLKLVPLAPDVALDHEVNQSGSPGSVTLKAFPTDPDNNITKVEFFQQGVSVGEVTSAPWEFSVNNLAKGTYHNYAVVTDATGYKGYSAPVYFDVTWPPPVVTLSSTVNTGVAPGSVTLAAVPSDPNNAITKVEFFSQETLLGERTGSPWSFEFTNLVAGNYVVSAKVTNSAGQVGTSAPSYFTIGLNPSELLLDSDGDGLSAADENLLGTSDQDPDSDGDGVPDNIDGTPRVPNSQNFTASSLLVTSPLR